MRIARVEGATGTAANTKQPNGGGRIKQATTSCAPGRMRAMLRCDAMRCGGSIVLVHLGVCVPISQCPRAVAGSAEVQ